MRDGGVGRRQANGHTASVETNSEETRRRETKDGEAGISPCERGKEGALKRRKATRQ